MTSTSLWYFAYGSNLDPSTFLGRRRLRPLASEVARLDDWSLHFDLPVGRGERGCANVRPEAGALVWGVAYELTPEAFDHLDRTEGVPRAYRRVPVPLTLPGGEPLAAWTYHAERGDPTRKPSRRYLGLLLTGARHHGLPTDWVTTLRAWPLAVDERDTQLELFGAASDGGAGKAE